MIRIEAQGQATRIVLDRPDRRNALDWPMTAALHDGIRAAADDGDCRLLVIAGAGGHFCAGRDLGALTTTPELPVILERDRTWAEIFRLLDRSPKPSLALVEGYAVAGGFTLAMGCDFVLATRTAQFAAAEMKQGFPAAVNTPILTNLVGSRLALELLVFGDLVGAERLYELGLINRLADDPAGLRSLAADWIERLLALDQEAVALTKESHRAARNTPLADALTAGAQQNALLAAAGVFQAAAVRHRARRRE